MSITTPESLHAQIEALKLENERLGKIVEQLSANADVKLPTPAAMDRLQLSDSKVRFDDGQGWISYVDCPELAAYLRAKEGKA